jgi:copper transport protein
LAIPALGTADAGTSGPGIRAPSACARHAVLGRVIAALLLIVAAFGLGVAGAGPAAAHAQLLSTDPAVGAQLPNSPDHVSLTFGEAVTFVPGGFHLLDHTGADVKLGSANRSGATVVVGIPTKLTDGAYVFSWRVVSADSHPVAGSIPFTVGNATALSGAGAPVMSMDPGTPGATRVLADVNRWIGYVGAVGGAGTVFFAALCWPAGRRDRTVRRIGVTGSVLVALTAVAALPLQASLADGVSLNKVFGDGALPAVFHTTFGYSAGGRIVLGLLLAVLIGMPRRAPALETAARAVAVGILACFSWTGHPSVSKVPAFTIADDMVHMAAVVTWLGGLTVLAVRLLPNPPADMHAVLTRWSRTAMWAVSVLVVSGVVQAWRELQSVHALLHTDYGRWVIIKSIGLVILVALGNVGRIRVQAWTRARASVAREPVGASLGAMRAVEQEPILGRLRQSVAAELVIAGGVLVATSLLVVSDPHMPMSTPGMASAAHAPSTAGGTVTLPTGPVVTVQVAPAAAGTPTVNITTVSAAGAVIDPVEVDATAALASRGIEPIPLKVTRTTAGHYVVTGAPLGFPGQWAITVTVRTSDIDSGVGTVNVTLN